MLNDYLPLMILFVISTALGFLVIAIGALLGPKRPTERKAKPYESGMVPYGSGMRRISVRYYLIAVLFILFDVEIIFFLPWMVVFRALGVSGLVEFLVFIAVVVAGYVYAWKKGALEWE